MIELGVLAQKPSPSAGNTSLERHRRKQRQDLLLDRALSLYSMHRMEVFWARQHDVHALVAWGDDTAVVAFRGTASLTNVLSDLKAGPSMT